MAFAFATGDDPRVLVRASVGESPDGPWSPAGFSDPTPTLTGPSYWVRFDITNVDQLNAVLTDIDISGFDAGSFLGEDICELEAPVPKDGEAVCIIGGSDDSRFSREGTRSTSSWAAPVRGRVSPSDGSTHRSRRVWSSPAPGNSFVLVFDTTEGFRVDGTADGSEVEIDVDGISGSVRLDCTGGSPFDGDPALKAYVIENFSADGEPGGRVHRHTRPGSSNSFPTSTATTHTTTSGPKTRPPPPRSLSRRRSPASPAA